jgi:5'-methylthioinosine phosphorylase
LLAIIGGSGLSGLANLEVTHRQVLRTPYGEPSGPLTFGRVGGRPVAFLARHGHGHTIPPHEVNYCANLWALKEQKVSGIVSIASVGGIAKENGPGCLIIPDQIIDYTWGRRSTFFEGPGAKVTHIDFTEPFSAGLRKSILAAAKASGEAVIDGGVYAATQGPRLETAAEINRLERDGAGLVGMTAMPEAALARELGLEYATIAVVANYAAGRGDSAHGISMDKIEAVLEGAMCKVRKIIEHLVSQ